MIIEPLKAEHGDAIVIRIDNDSNQIKIVIDGGPTSGNLHKFSNNPGENMRMRIDGLRRFMGECCEEKSGHDRESVV